MMTTPPVSIFLTLLASFCFTMVDSRDASVYSYKLYMAPAETSISSKFVVVYRDTVTEDWRENLLSNFADVSDYKITKEFSFYRSIVADTIEIGPNDEGAMPAGIDMEEILYPLLKEHDVKYIEQEQVTRIASDQAYPPNPGLDRIDQKEGLDNNYHYEYTGEGVTAFILDTGIRMSHEEFDNDRVSCAFNAFDEEGGCDDKHGHGTSVAAIIGGKKYGVAKKAKLFSVKVFNEHGESSTSKILRGIEYVTVLGILNLEDKMSMVANLSAASHSSRAINQASTAASQYFFFSVAAGNYEDEACDYSPAGAIGVLTVAASDPTTDERAPTTNYGKCVDIFAPGVGIETAGNHNDKASVVRSGSSMASPHATGAGALFLEANPTATPQLIKQRMIVRSVPHALTDIKGSPNLLLNLQSLFGTDPVLPDSRTEDDGRSGGQKFGVFLGWLLFIATVLAVPYVVYRRKTRTSRLHREYVTEYVD